jgi:hypothetical protein
MRANIPGNRLFRSFFSLRGTDPDSILRHFCLTDSDGQVIVNEDGRVNWILGINGTKNSFVESKGRNTFRKYCPIVRGEREDIREIVATGDMDKTPGPFKQSDWVSLPGPAYLWDLDKTLEAKVHDFVSDITEMAAQHDVAFSGFTRRLLRRKNREPKGKWEDGLDLVLAAIDNRQPFRDQLM